MTVRPSQSAFVGNLSYFCTQEHLWNLFAPFGGIRSVKICRTKDKEPLYYGFVHLTSSSAVEASIKGLHGKLFMGRKLKVNNGEKRPNKALEVVEDISSGIQLLFSFVSTQLVPQLTEEVLHHVFSTFGNVLDIVVKSFEVTSVSGAVQKQGGYGFVVFEQHAAAHDAITRLSRENFHWPETQMDIHFDCKLSRVAMEKMHSAPASHSSPNSSSPALTSVPPVASVDIPSPSPHAEDVSRCNQSPLSLSSSASVSNNANSLSHHPHNPPHNPPLHPSMSMSPLYPTQQTHIDPQQQQQQQYYYAHQQSQPQTLSLPAAAAAAAVDSSSPFSSSSSSSFAMPAFAQNTQHNHSYYNNYNPHLYAPSSSMSSSASLSGTNTPHFPGVYPHQSTQSTFPMVASPATHAMNSAHLNSTAIPPASSHYHPQHPPQQYPSSSSSPSVAPGLPSPMTSMMSMNDHSAVFVVPASSPQQQQQQLVYHQQGQGYQQPMMLPPLPPVMMPMNMMVVPNPNSNPNPMMHYHQPTDYHHRVHLPSSSSSGDVYHQNVSSSALSSTTVYQNQAYPSSYPFAMEGTNNVPEHQGYYSSNTASNNNFVQYAMYPSNSGYSEYSGPHSNNFQN